MDQEKLIKATKMMIEAFGEDPDREGLRETPERVAKMYAEIFSSLDAKRPEAVTNYKVFHVADTPEMVAVQEIPFYSMCEHHLLPFFGTVSVAYVPKNGRVIGLSKIPRLVDFVSHKPGMQERVTTELVQELTRLLDPAGVAVVVAARHMCMEMRGVTKAGQFTYTSHFTGAFLDQPNLKQEFLYQVRGRP